MRAIGGDGRLRPAAALIEEGRAALPAIGRTRFLRDRGLASEVEWKRRQVASGTVMYHLHAGLSTWDATEQALREIESGLAGAGHTVDRFGLALDRAMGLPEERRAFALKETGPRMTADEWSRVGEAVSIQPHLGDHMIGFAAGFENTLHALSAGVTTVGNLGQFLAFDLVGGSDEIEVTETTVKALAVLAAHRDAGALAHSNLCDSPAVSTSHYGAYLGWAALEQHVVEVLIGARLAHCYGNLVNEPLARAVVHFALDDLRGRRSVGSMVYGNTVGYAAGAAARNTAALATQVLTDIALQLRRPTGHAVNPVPLSEAERIPTAAEIVDAHLLARELEKDARRSGDLYDWGRLQRLGATAAEYAVRFRDRALALLADGGVDVADAAQLLLALRRVGAADLERLVDIAPPLEIGRLEPWKATHVRDLAERLRTTCPRLDGMRVLLGVLEVHDVVRDALARVLPQAGAEVIVLPQSVSIAGVARAAVDEDTDAVVLAVYNGNALELGRELVRHAATAEYHGVLLFGGLLNQDTGEDLPLDVRPELAALGIRCVSRAEDLGQMLAESAARSRA